MLMELWVLHIKLIQPLEELEMLVKSSDERFIYINFIYILSRYQPNFIFEM